MEIQAICAIATPPGSSALGIIRISGKNLKELTKKIFSKELENRKAILVDIRNNKRLLDNCISIYYKAPKSYTGEDMIEIICHGNHVIMNSVITLLNGMGIRHAEPGEFTERAFFNDKLNLIQAEAISDLISASDIRAVKAAQNSLSGKFVDEINIIRDEILSIRAEIESLINFPEDDDVPDLSIAKIKKSILKVLTDMEILIKKSKEGMSLNNTLTYAVVGKPNSGKSSFINFLLREDASIVTSKTGTTRDSITYQLSLNDRIVNIIDTAGIHETSDEIEKEGIARSALSVLKADRIFYLVDDNQGLTAEDTNLIKKYSIKDYYLVFNKIDLTNKEAKITSSWNGPSERTKTGFPFFGYHPKNKNISYAFGYSGNGVLTCHVGGEILSSMVLEENNEWTKSNFCKGPIQMFPPEPFRWLGALIIRNAVRRKESAQEKEVDPKWIDKQLAKLAISVGRVDFKKK
mgnify:CR=1 FL=1